MAAVFSGWGDLTEQSAYSAEFRFPWDASSSRGRAYKKHSKFTCLKYMEEERGAV